VFAVMVRLCSVYAVHETLPEANILNARICALVPHPLSSSRTSQLVGLERTDQRDSGAGSVLLSELTPAHIQHAKE
jgi:hypothetical protein